MNDGRGCRACEEQDARMRSNGDTAAVGGRPPQGGGLGEDEGLGPCEPPGHSHTCSGSQAGQRGGAWRLESRSALDEGSWAEGPCKRHSMKATS